ncbi:LpqB [Alloactinosynnema sp. L-07]|uniref:LpqB family beta-propeller domain-containing protein n=1 Tax=Alloactinosynnema sp. L-07 TaxID=1653480 RepID=UPI00065F083C|nr:LpqB family beta-propeller domain-containing protein [Alloactinosynnema sp. L-07]CRK59707.1 LpqB [Alloactinosynnema sp. L-07]
MTRLLVAVLVFAAVTSGCANIPDRTPPKVVLDQPVTEPSKPGKPRPDLDPFSLVQDFVNAAGNPDAAKTYLTEEAGQHWPSSQVPTILQDNFTMPPLTGQENGVDPANPDEKVVVLTGTVVGRLRDNHVFSPEPQSLEHRVVVRRQPDRQWRIATPPPDLLITQSKFDVAYRRVNLQFFDSEQRVMVSDPRYVENEPREGLEDRVMRLLVAGASDSLKTAVRSPLAGINLRTNAVLESGAVVVNLTQVDKSVEDRKRIAAQIVESLREVTSSPVRILSQDRPLLPQVEWRPSDVDSYDALTTPKPDLLGLVAHGGRIYSMRDGKAIEGPSGAGAYDIASAAQSIDGTQLAIVQRTAAGMRLRIGALNADLAEVSHPAAATLTRPTWLYGDNGGREAWTVLDGTVVIRAVRTPQGGWEDLSVDASELTANGGTITQLRLSRDGVRVAAVVNGEIKIASVVRTDDAVSISLPRTLHGAKIKEAVSVDWMGKDALIVATRQNLLPVVKMPIDGLAFSVYNYSTLTQPITAITASPSRPAVVTDGSGMWSAQEAGPLWQAHPHGQGPGSVPFYPG